MMGDSKTQISGIPTYLIHLYLIFYFLHSLCRECLVRFLLVYIVIKCPLCRTIVNPKCLMKQPKNSVKTSKKNWTTLMKSRRFDNGRTTKKTKKRSCWLLKSIFFSLLLLPECGESFISKTFFFSF